jgi:hypothetical protein
VSPGTCQERLRRRVIPESYYCDADAVLEGHASVPVAYRHVADTKDTGRILLRI